MKTAAERAAEELAVWSRDMHRTTEARLAHIAATWDEIRPLIPAALPPGPVCVLGCNRGWLELPAAEAFPDREIHALDLISPAEEPEVWRLARASGCVKYFPGTDLQDGLPWSGYALVIAASVLHHCPRPDDAAKEIRRAMHPEGRLVLREYIGDRGLAPSDLRYRVAERIWRALPESYRRKRDGTIQEHVHRHDPEEARGWESYASDQLRSAFLRRFAIDRETIAHPLTGYRLTPWQNGPRDPTDPQIDALLRAFEDVLLAEGWLGGEDWTAVLRPREASWGAP